MRDRKTALLLLVILTVLACTAYMGYLRTSPKTVAGLMPRTQEGSRRPFRAVVIFHPEDCDGRIDFMHAFARPRWRDLFSTGALVIGGAAEAETAAQTLRARGLSIPVSAVRSEAHPGRLLGYTSTPYLLVVDRQDRLRIAVPGPSSTSELRALERATEGLLDPVPQAH
jgi:hypothetical protein